MVRAYARRRVTGPLKTLIERLHAKGKEDFDMYDIYAEQQKLVGAKDKRTRKGTYNLTRREIAASLASKQKELGIEPVGFKRVEYGPHRGRSLARVWRIQH